MIIHEIFAQICNGAVQNIIVCDNYPTADHLTKCVYGSDAFAVDCLQYACTIGDSYHDGAFWRMKEDGTEEALPYLPTEAQEIQLLKAENESLILVLADAIGGAVS